MIKPHGGKLVNRILSEEQAEDVLAEAKEWPKIEINFDRVLDVKNIARGVYSPLEGFLGKEDLESVLDNMRLASGVAWSIPIVLDVLAEKADSVKGYEKVLLVDSKDKAVAVFNLDEIYTYDKKKYAECVYRTTEEEHPGVKRLNQKGEVLLGGTIDLIDNSKEPFYEYNLDPVETRVLFKEKGWNTVAAFQTRNPPHRAHEYLQKTALESVDGLFINPVIGKKKAGDFKDEVIMEAYGSLVKNHYPKNRVVLSILPMQMRYAGPREAIFHAIIRKNFGCTHFIVGRDHAGVGNYYGTYEAQEIFEKLPDLGVTPLKFEHSAYCKICKGMVTAKTCPHDKENWIAPSGTKVRAIVSEKQMPPEEFMRPDIAKILMEAKNPYVE